MHLLVSHCASFHAALFCAGLAVLCDSMPTVLLKVSFMAVQSAHCVVGVLSGISRFYPERLSCPLLLLVQVPILIGHL